MNERSFLRLIFVPPYFDYQSIPNPDGFAGAPDCGANGEALPVDEEREEGEAAPEEDCGAKGEFDGEAPVAVFGLD